MATAKKAAAITAFSRLPGLLQRAAENPSSNTVHKLRTTIRRAETVLRVEAAHDTAKVLNQTKRIRRRAGRLRDIDVQLSLLAALGRKRDNDCMAVTTALREERETQEQKIRNVIEQEFDSGLIKRLRRSGTAAMKHAGTESVDLNAIANKFMEKLSQIHLTEETLHEFRTETKKLRYRAELAPENDRRNALISELKKVQDAIGHWHDGVTLSATAVEVLGASKRNSLISILRAKDHSRYLEALRAVERARHSIPGLFEAPSLKKTALPAQVSEPNRQAATA